MTSLQTRDRPAGDDATTLPIDPRMAARWASVRRQQGRRRGRRSAGVLIVVTALIGAWVLSRSPVLAVHHVVIRGLGHTSRASVLTVTGLDRPRPMVDIDLGAIRRQVLAMPWVGHVGVQRDWPTTVTIVIAERTPVAQLAEPAGHTAVVDDAGRVLAVGREASQVVRDVLPPLPLLGGVSRVGPAGSYLASDAQGVLAVVRGVAARPLANQGGEAFTVAEVTQSPDGTLSATLSPARAGSSGPITVVFGSADQLPAKVTALRSVLAQLDPGVQATIDVQVADAPVLTNEKKRSTVSTTQRG